MSGGILTADAIKKAIAKKIVIEPRWAALIRIATFTAEFN